MIQHAIFITFARKIIRPNTWNMQRDPITGPSIIYYQTKLISTKRSQNLKTHIKTSSNSKVNIKELKLTKQLNIKVADKSSSPLSAIACKK